MTERIRERRSRSGGGSRDGEASKGSRRSGASPDDSEGWEFNGNSHSRTFHDHSHFRFSYSLILLVKKNKVEGKALLAASNGVGIGGNGYGGYVYERFQRL